MSHTSSLPIAFQGEPGAYSEAALLEHFGPGTPSLPCESFEAVFAAVENGQAAAGLIAIENSVAGSIHHNYDLLLQHSLTITGEHYLRVRHCLIANPGVRLSDLRRVISHPQALAQCDGYLRAQHLQAEVFYDTAGSVKYLKERRAQEQAGGEAAQEREAEITGAAANTPERETNYTGAIASSRAAEVYQMQILAEGIEDNPANFTRFLVIRKAAGPSAENTAGKATTETAKTTLVFSLGNQPGSLFKALSVFALRDINLTKIESRPLVGRPWDYLFYVDITGAASDPTIIRALSHLEEYATSLRVLGSYPRHMPDTNTPIG